MKHWITPDGCYYVGMYVAEGSIEVTERPSAMHEWVGGEWILNVEAVKSGKIQALSDAYELDRERLNKAWLSALIADGVNEVARQAVIVGQMAALDAQLEVDIFAVLMEE